MSNLNDESKYDNLTESLQFIFEQQMKGIYTCLPAVVQSYDPENKRASVAPALLRLLTNGETTFLPSVVNVPVCFPTGGGFSLLFPVKQGDACLLMFSQRGIENFKETYGIERPDEGFFSLNDAVAIMGFGPLSIIPASSDGAALQTDNASDYIAVEQGKIVVETTALVEVNAPLTEMSGNLQVAGVIGAAGYQSYSGVGSAQVTGGLSVTGGTVEHNGTNIGDDHVHGGVQTGGSNTGGPQ